MLPWLTFISATLAAALAGRRAVQGWLYDPAATVTLVTSSPDQAARLRRYLEDHECLSRNPSPAELEALDAASRNGGEFVSVPRRAWRPRLFRA